MKKQSSIEWLEERIKKTFIPLSNEESILKDIEQAKQMHKQEIKDAWNSAYGGDSFNDGIDYYNETYEKTR